MAISNSTQARQQDSSDDQPPAVLNIRRPGGLHSEVHSPEPAPGTRSAAALDDAPLPQTALRLPDLSAHIKQLPKHRFQRVSFGEFAQWAAIALGALFAVWLIFGGSGQLMQNGSPGAGPATPPAWNPPPLAADAPEAPRWQPSSAPAEPAAAAPSAAPPFEQPAGTAPEVPETPAAPELPAWDTSAQQRAPGGPAAANSAARQPVYQAQRDNPNPPPGAQPGEVQSLGVTVPVTQ